MQCQSSTEAEICAGVNATKDIKFVRAILQFLKLNVEEQLEELASTYEEMEDLLPKLDTSVF